ncbi:uncharacterized protein LOC130700366 [Daphnia carinata]|uniref:uncharacterized protein LOC130700366 n=1 Tax=Daphnia carinata TaxID=120202 RepID=UPI00257E50F1|nr:uncharacterized protein LOC130700366 [Daphnia carinata]
MGDRGGDGGERGRGMSDRGGVGGERGRGVGIQEGSRGSSRGRGVGSRGDRGGFRGSRGSFRGSDRGASFGRGRGRGYVVLGDQKQVTLRAQKEFETQLGLQLYVAFKKTPVLTHELEKLPGFHSISAPPSNNELEKIILFRDMASLEAAKTTLDVHENVQSAKRMGLESICSMNLTPSACKVYLGFGEAVKENAVKKLDSKIKEVAIFSKTTSCALQFATPEQAKFAGGKLKSRYQKIKNLLDVEMYYPKNQSVVPEDQGLMTQMLLRFSDAYDMEQIKAIEKITDTPGTVVPLYSCTAQFATRKEAVDAVGRLKSKIGENSLRLVNLYFDPLSTVKNVELDKIVLRDVPKNVTVKDFVTQFPKAISVVIYKKTFPASKFCHAHVGFASQKEAAEVLYLTDLKIGDRKVYIFPGLCELMHDLSSLGVIEKKNAVKDAKVEEEPPSKKRKTEKGCEKNDDEDVEDEDDEDEDDEDEDVEDEDVEDEDVEDEDDEDEGVEDEDEEAEGEGEEDETEGDDEDEDDESD